MKKLFKIAGLVIIGLFLIIQFVPKNLPVTKTENPDTIQFDSASQEVSIILQASCFDCHSNQTNYPWYSYVAPISWLIKHDVEEGREELNFSEWAGIPKRKAIKKLNEIEEVLEEGEMPLSNYTLLHPSAKLTEQQKALVVEWTKKESERIINN